MSRMAPQIRFKVFTDNWEERKLEDASEIIDGDRGKNYPSGDDFKNSGHTLFLSATNVTKQGFVFKENQYITNLKSELLGNGKVNLNDIILTSRGSIGHIGLYDERINENIPHARINSGMLILRTNKFNSPSFIAQFLKAPLGIKQIKLISFGSAQPQLTKKDIKKFKITLPKIEEQIKIGAFLKQLDDTIALHQRMLDLLKEQKKGFLQKMFPKKNAEVPELRFSGFGDDWKERKLGDEVQIVMGQSPNSENYTDNPNNYILVQGNADMKNGHVFPRVWTTQVTKQADKNDLILSVRAPVGDIGKTAYDVVIGRGVAAIKGNEFIFQSLGKMKSDGYWTRYSTGSTFESINSTDIKEAIINVPAVEEQSKIGSFFKAIDNTIALHQRKLDLLKEQKKGFLQKMFVS
ncbi:restriction endonuclease subunit S [Leuconostoc suionicum]|nr:restriction endonuclease subunit S [Leuconostoc suionicum]MDI6551329.1 restriction endonuclease subunit S [Leuconostoc suionicum]